MSQSVQILASGPGWKAVDVVCTAAAGDRSYEEAHGDYCIAAVNHGTFRYRSRQGSAVLAPGGLLLGNIGACFECGHEHGRGDRCLSFHFAPAYLEGIYAEVPGARKLGFEAVRLPPIEALTPLLAEAEAARDEGDAVGLEEVGLRLAGATASLLQALPADRPAPSRRDEKRVAEAVRLIESEAGRDISLAELAREAATSPYHFLRVFRDVAGMTPHQFVLKTRLHRAALRLIRTTDPIVDVAYGAGFNDLSTFNRRFRRVMGDAPRAYRLRHEKAASRAG